MAEHINLSESEEMYLVTIARLQESGLGELIPLSELASELDIAPVSTNQMVRKLEEDSWVVYAPYKGVSLTASGEQVAQRVLRHRRLWEVFLSEHLRFSPLEAEKLACRMEHILPEGAAERLAAFLGHPITSPQGKPIPPSQFNEPIHTDLRLNQLKAGERGAVTQVTADAATRVFLASEGLFPGAVVAVLAVAGDGSLLLGTGKGASLHLAACVASDIWVSQQPGD